MTLAILDLGYGNVESVRLGFKRLGADPALVNDTASVASADKLVVPGVGHAGFAMEQLEGHGLVDALKARTAPMLGICVGMQLFHEGSEETDRPLLGLVPGTVREFAPAPGRPVPHMGWTKVADVADGLGLFEGDQLYFAHSYACPVTDTTAATADYGGEIAVALRKDNLWAAQFHPERSSKAGANFLKAFLAS